MKNVLLSIAMFILVTGCTVSKQVSRQLEKSTTETESQAETNSNLIRKATTDAHTTTNSKTTINVDTSFTSPGSQLSGEKPLSNLLNGDSLSVETSDLKGVVSLDTLTGRVSFRVTEKPKVFPLRYNKTTESQQTIDTNVDEKQRLITTSASDNKASQVLKKENIEKDIKRSIPWGWFIAIAIFAVIVFFFIKAVKGYR
jgi:hypothetical protein